MSGCSAISFSDAEIRRQATGSTVRDLRDPRHPGLYLRFAKDRERATWYLVSRKKWSKIGGYPALPFKSLAGVLPQIRARLAVDPEASASAGELATVGQLLAWYSDRQSRDRSLSRKRRSTTASAIKCHLKPRLNDLLVPEATRAALDERVMWPLQEELSLSYVRLLWGILVVAFRQAERLKLIAGNPIAGFKFTDFTKARVLPKAARLRGVQIEPLVSLLADQFEADPAGVMLATLMLCHGTRVGESRQSTWPHFTLAEMGEWFIPAENTKTRCEHRLPLTGQVVALLKRYREWQSGTGYKGVYLFPAKSGKPISEGQACAVFTRLGGGEWTSHDLRKLARTAWTDLGVDYLIGEMLVNHTLTRNVQTYIHTHAEQLKREALEKWHERLDSVGFGAIHGLIDGRNGNSQNAAEAADGAGFEAIQETVKGEDSK